MPAAEPSLPTNGDGDRLTNLSECPQVNSHELTIYTFHDIRERLRQPSDYSFAMIAADIRKLFFDQNAILPQAIKTSGRKFVIYASKDRNIDRIQNLPPNAFWMAGDAFAPETATIEIPVNEFGKQVIIQTSRANFAVKDVIRYVANKRGGVHLDTTWKPTSDNSIGYLETSPC